MTSYSSIAPLTLTLLTANAIAAANLVLIPVKTDYLSIQGIPLIIETINNLRAQANPDLGILGVLPTMFNARYTRDNEVLAALKATLGPSQIRVFDPIPRSVGFEKATSEGKPAVEILPDTSGVENYYKIADEIINYGQA